MTGCDVLPEYLSEISGRPAGPVGLVLWPGALRRDFRVHGQRGYFLELDMTQKCTKLREEECKCGLADERDPAVLPHLPCPGLRRLPGACPSAVMCLVFIPCCARASIVTLIGHVRRHELPPNGPDVLSGPWLTMGALRVLRSNLAKHFCAARMFTQPHPKKQPKPCLAHP